MTPTELYAVVAPGLEGAAAEELRRYAFADVQPGKGGVRFSGSPLRANRALAIPTRIYQRVARFRCHTFAQLEAGLRAVDWAPFGGLTPKASTKASRLYHTGAIAERAAQIVPSGPGELLVRVDRDRCTLSVDTSGDRLHRRGWRQEGAAAPLRETLAAGVLALVGWRPGVALFDPMCGSGTLLVEAAVAAAGRLPGADRVFPCEAWCPAEALPPEVAVPTLIAGRDRSASAVEAARRNAERARVEVELSVGDARAATPPAERGLLVCNPPYGRRAKGATAAYDALGALLVGPFRGWDAAILCADPTHAERLGRPVGERHPLRNGGLKVELLVSPRR